MSNSRGLLKRPRRMLIQCRPSRAPPASGRVSGARMANNSRLFERIEKLYDVGLLSQARALIAGCGSGGSQVALQLAMSGIRSFDFYDNQTLGMENVIRHACGL